MTRRIPGNGIALLEHHFTVDLNRLDRDLTPKELLERLDGKFAVIATLGNRFNRDVVSRLNSVKVISNFAVGYDNVDVAAATERGIVVTNTPGVLTDATADMTFGLLLAVARRIVEGDRFIRAKKFKGWTPTLMLGHEVSGKTIGIVGAGRIGTAVACRAQGFGMRVLYCARHSNKEIDSMGGELVPVGRLLAESDFVSVNVSLNDGTRGLIGKKELALMKPSAILVNTARGEVVDEGALIYAIRHKTIAGAGLDVYPNEPRLNPALLKFENVVLAPHLGSATIETRARMAEMAAMNAIAVLKGERPPAVVNAEAFQKL